MKKTRILSGLMVLALAVSSAFAGGSSDKKQAENVEIIISAAASLTNAMNDLIASYQSANPNVKVTPVYGSSGTLRKQIEQGAPTDIFFSAAQNHMDAMKEEGLTLDSTIKDMLENKVVLISPKDSKKGISSYQDCNTDKVTRIALGIPESVPAGSYAKQVFESLGCWDAVNAKAVFAKDVRQVLSYVEQGEVDAGVVYATDAAISDKITIICSAPEKTHEPIIYPACVIKASEHVDEATKFLNFLSSTEAANVFAKYGFALVK